MIAVISTGKKKVMLMRKISPKNSRKLITLLTYLL